VLVLAALLALTLAPRASAQGVSTWSTGPAFEQQLRENTSVSWSGTPLREGLQRLSELQRVCILLDRRIDPTTRLEVNASGPMAEVLVAIAKAHNATVTDLERRRFPGSTLAFTRLGPVVFGGSPNVALYLRTINELRKDEVRQFPGEVRQKLVRVQSLRWDDLAEPRQILERLAQTSGVQIAGLDLVPHDLWPGADLPPLGLVERITLVAIQFDLTFRISPDGEQVTLRPADQSDLALERNYPAGPSPQQRLEQWRQLLPETPMELAGGQIRVSGRLEDHERLEGINTQSGQPATSSGGQEVYTLNIRNIPAAQVYKQLADKLKLELRYDAAGLRDRNVNLDRRITFRVEKVSLEELWRTATAPLGLEAKIEDGVVEIRPK
jgi:hypothetical protein